MGRGEFREGMATQFSAESFSKKKADFLDALLEKLKWPISKKKLIDQYGEDTVTDFIQELANDRGEYEVITSLLDISVMQGTTDRILEIMPTNIGIMIETAFKKYLYLKENKDQG